MQVGNRSSTVHSWNVSVLLVASEADCFSQHYKITKSANGTLWSVFPVLHRLVDHDWRGGHVSVAGADEPRVPHVWRLLHHSLLHVSAGQPFCKSVCRNVQSDKRKNQLAVLVRDSECVLLVVCVSWYSNVLHSSGEAHHSGGRWIKSLKWHKFKFSHHTFVCWILDEDWWQTLHIHPSSQFWLELHWVLTCNRQ